MKNKLYKQAIGQELLGYSDAHFILQQNYKQSVKDTTDVTDTTF